jgi:squalene-hopene/tetraprenyl-beta-curcumene cyclase
MVARYGKDRTFAVPILANCALAGQADWNQVAWLPFELACLPHGLYRFLRLHVVSYALPALIAIGQLIHVRRPTWNLVIRMVRQLAIGPTLRTLEAIQPESGGFLEAIPLTSFVTMSLAAAGRGNHAVACKGVEFLRSTARPDGSWPIDSNLSVWLTTLSVNALAAGTTGLERADPGELERTRDWLLDQQLRTVHPYTSAAPGGWGWSHLSGSVPDADDTAGALLALSHLSPSIEAAEAAVRGIAWLCDLQNSDGGWPTFCRGWGQLPFDRSGTDLTAHVLRAFNAWHERGPFRSSAVDLPGPQQSVIQLKDQLRVSRAVKRAMGYLEGHQRSDGSWTPLWFGNQHVMNDKNPTYGTCKVLSAYAALRCGAGVPPAIRSGAGVTGEYDSGAGGDGCNTTHLSVATRAIGWLLSAQNSDGGWGGSMGIESSVEETALAVDALASTGGEKADEQIGRGIHWLLDRVESGEWRKPSPIGLYFAKLWYFEKLYPLIFTVAALGRTRRLWNPPVPPTSA